MSNVKVERTACTHYSAQAVASDGRVCIAEARSYGDAVRAVIEMVVARRISAERGVSHG